MSAGLLQIVGAAISGMAQIRAAQAQQVEYEVKARNAVIQGRVDAANYKMQGAEVLENMNRAIAASTARGAAGNLDPYASGETVDLVNTYSLRVGAGEFNVSRANAGFAMDNAYRQAEEYRMAGKTAVQYATASAVGNMFTTAGQAKSSGPIFSPSGTSGNATG